MESSHCKYFVFIGTDRILNAVQHFRFLNLLLSPFCMLSVNLTSLMDSH